MTNEQSKEPINRLMSISESEAENIAANLSDFALFLTVMKHKEAYQNTLSIILDEPDIMIREVKVEQVVLNKSGKRAKYTFTEQSEEWEGIKMDILDVGINRGISRGEYKKLIFQVGRKKVKGISAVEIADMFEEDPDLIQKIYDALDQYDAVQDWHKILEIVHPT